MAPRKLACVVLCLELLSSTACKSPVERAQDHRELIRLGMTKDEVTQRLGRPDVRSYEMTGEKWVYTYGLGFMSFSGTAIKDTAVTLIKLPFVAAFYVAIAYIISVGGGWGTPIQSADVGERGPKVGLAVTFSPEGVVIGIRSLLEK